MQHLGHFSSGCCFRSGLCGSHHAGALTFGLPLSVAQGNLIFRKILIFFTHGTRERGIYGDYPEMETYGLENASF